MPDRLVFELPMRCIALGAPAVASVILGGVTPEEVERNVKAMQPLCRRVSGAI